MAIDIYSTAFQEDPFPAYERLRRDEPVYREPRYGAYLLTRHHDVSEALQDHDTFRSGAGPAPMPTPGGAVGLPLLAATDPPYHDELRNLISGAFTPRRITQREPRIRELARELVAQIPEGEEFDLVQAVSIPLPVTIIAEILGVHPERQVDFRRWSDAFVGLLERPPETTMIQATQELLTYFHELEKERRESPRDDMISQLLAAEIDGRRLTSEELDAFFIMLLVGGNETTTNLISNQLQLLAERPELWTALREDRSLLPSAIEETVRWDSPVQNLGREVTRDISLHGVKIPAGSRAVVSFGAANRDPEVFDAPDDYRVDRDPSQHLGFGLGRHYCMGTRLARLEGVAALDALLDRFEEIAPGDTTGARLHSTVIRGFESLPLLARSTG